MKKFRYSITFILKTYLLGLVIFSIIRILMFIALNTLLSDTAQCDYLLQSTAFLRGLWLDNVIACYILILPLTLISICALFNYYASWILRFSRFYTISFYFFAFLISIANIPYFEYFFRPINSSVFNWIAYSGTTLGMIWEEIGYMGYLILFVLLYGGYHGLVRHTFYNNLMLISALSSPWNWKSFLLIFSSSVILISACLFGIRGRMGYNPIKISAAYYCKDAFLNQLGINPVFSLLNSTLDDNRQENKELHLMDDKKAIKQVQEYLQHSGIENVSPIAYTIEPSAKLGKKNVILIFMESMSCKLMTHFGQEKNLTPFLDSLYEQSLSFSNFYSAGIHTNHGLYATLYSFPVILKRNAMKGSVIQKYSGLPTVLKEHGYRTLFFMTHESQYDNMNAFLRTNGYDEIYAQENYPKDKIVNSFGVQDDFLYEYALDKINQLDLKQPFFATLLSISNHPPYVIPDFFIPKNTSPEDQIVEYADWAIQEFMREAKKQKWFNNTIFVFVADHGKMVGKADSEIPESYNHIPLMIYNSQIKAKVDTCYGGQIDITPTLLGLMGLGYTNLGFGIDLNTESRPCIFYAADNMFGVRNDSHLYMYAPESNQEFFYTTNNQHILEYTDTDSVHLSLKEYGFSMFQATEYLVGNGKTIVEIKN